MANSVLIILIVVGLFFIYLNYIGIKNIHLNNIDHPDRDKAFGSILGTIIVLLEMLCLTIYVVGNTLYNFILWVDSVPPLIKEI